MQKSVAILMTFLLMLAGCLDTVEDVVSEIVPGCDDEAALNYDETADNSQACVTEQILIDAVDGFILLVEDGPSLGDTAGMVQSYSGDMEGTQADIEMTMIVTGDSTYMAQNLDAGMMQYSSEMWTVGNTDGSTTHYGDVLGEKFHMVSEMSIDETLYAMLSGDEDEIDEEMGDEEDSEMDEVSPEMFDWTSGNFAFEEVISEDGNLYLQFSADLKVTAMPDMMFANTVMLNSDLTFRSWSVDVEDNITSITILTMAEIDDIMAMNADEFVDQMPLPFTLEESWGEDLSEFWGDETDTSGSSATGRNATEGYYFSMYVCNEFVNGDIMTNTSDVDEFNSLWTGSGLDDSMCGSDIIENHTFTSTTVTFPEHFVFYDGEEEMIMGAIHDGMTVTAYFNNWSEMTGDSTAEYCEGDYDYTNDTCYWEVADIVNADDTAVEMYDYEDGDYFTMYYEFNESTDSGIMMWPEDFFMCADESEYVDADYVDDGYEDCMDGSDESGDVTPEPEGYYFEIYDCQEFVDGEMMTNTSDVMEFWNMWQDTFNWDYCHTEGPEEYNFTNTSITIPENFVIYESEDNMTMSIMHDGMYVTLTWHNWSEETGDIYGEYCDGDYDSDNDSCMFYLAEILYGDENAVMMYDLEEGEEFLMLYQYDSTTNSGLMMFPEPYYMCADESDYIEADSVNDGFEDCMDGSDEYESESGEGYFDVVYDCYDILDAQVWNGTTDYEEFYGVWEATDLDDSICGESIEDSTTPGSGEFTLPTRFVMVADGFEVLEHNDTHFFVVYEDWSVMTNETCEGSYDTSTDVCLYLMGEIVESDEDSFTVSGPDMESTFLYQFNENTGSGLFMIMVEMFVCGSGETIDPDYVNDGYEDCMDGSDENYGSESSAWLEMYELYDNQTWELEGLEVWVYDEYDEVSTVELYIDSYYEDDWTLYDMYWDDMDQAYHIEWSNEELVNQYGLSTDDCYYIGISLLDSSGDLLDRNEVYYCPEGEESSIETSLAETGDYDMTTWEFYMDGLEFIIWGDTSEIGLMEMTIDENYQGDVSLMDMTYESIMDSHTIWWSVSDLLENYDVYEGQCYDFEINVYDMDGNFITGSYEWVCMPGDDEGGEEGDVTYFFVGSGTDGAPFEGVISDWEVHLMSCEYNEDGEEDCTYLDGESLSVAHQAGSDGENGFFFLDMDDSGTLSAGDAVGISSDHEYDEVKLYDSSLEMYAEENPAMPGFTAIFGVVCLLGAALLRKNE